MKLEDLNSEVEMTTDADAIEQYKAKITARKLTIYDPISVESDCWLQPDILQRLLRAGLVGTQLDGLPLRTRSKVVKELVCRSLGYPIPQSFAKTKPCFPGQNFDTYTQKSDNLQVWNEEIDPERRYAIIRISDECIITDVKVISGAELASYDKTGTLTQKYQARLTVGEAGCELVSKADTQRLLPHVTDNANVGSCAPVDNPLSGGILSITRLYEKLCPLVGSKFADRGSHQDRNRGADLHRLVCQALGYSTYQDNGQFPDITHQLLEVKLQTALTIDLGLVTPDSVDALPIATLSGSVVRHCDVRYAIFYGCTDGVEVEITHMFLTTGEAFFGRFAKCLGKEKNKKLQIPLPRNFFAG